MLTETKDSVGCRLLADAFSGAGYLPSGAAAVTLPAHDGPIQVIGAYVPSRDTSLEKTDRKRK